MFLESKKTYRLTYFVHELKQNTNALSNVETKRDSSQKRLQHNYNYTTSKRTLAEHSQYNLIKRTQISPKLIYSVEKAGQKIKHYLLGSKRLILNGCKACMERKLALNGRICHCWRGECWRISDHLQSNRHRQCSTIIIVQYPVA